MNGGDRVRFPGGGGGESGGGGGEVVVGNGEGFDEGFGSESGGL